MDGSNARPFASVITSATPLRTVATSEWVVPRSMPTARRRWCGSGEAPGSEICRRDMSGGRFGKGVRARRGGCRGDVAVDVAAAMLPFAPTGIHELHVMLV